MKRRRKGSREFREAAPRFRRRGGGSHLPGAGRGRSGQREQTVAGPAAVRAEAEPAAGATGGSHCSSAFMTWRFWLHFSRFFSSPGSTFLLLWQ
ncbi:hypothetical protein R6Z07F_005117 [Ovis aries]